MDSVNDNDFKSQRISLMILSIGIIMFTVGDGSVGTEGAIFGGTIHFEHTSVITNTGLLLYVWFNWMLILSVKDNSNEFLLNFKYYLYSSDEYKTIATDFLDKITHTNLYHGYCSENHLSESVMYSTDTNVNNRKPQLPPLLTSLIKPNRLFFNKPTHQMVDWDNANIDSWRRIKQYPLPLDTTPIQNTSYSVTRYINPLRMYKLELKCLLRAAPFHKQYAQIVAPFLISGIALLSLIFKHGIPAIPIGLYWVAYFLSPFYKCILIVIFGGLIWKGAK